MYKLSKEQLKRLKEGETAIAAGEFVPWKTAKAEAYREFRVALLKKSQRKGGAHAGKIRRAVVATS